MFQAMVLRFHFVVRDLLPSRVDLPKIWNEVLQMQLRGHVRVGSVSNGMQILDVRLLDLLLHRLRGLLLHPTRKGLRCVDLGSAHGELARLSYYLIY